MTSTTLPNIKAHEAEYDTDIVRRFVLASLFWCIAGLAMGVWLAFMLAFPQLNLGLEWTSFGRLRPVHTTLVVYAFTGNALIGTSFYVVQRTCRTALWGGREWPRFLFWCYQAFIFGQNR